MKQIPTTTKFDTKSPLFQHRRAFLFNGGYKYYLPAKKCFAEI